MTHTQGLVCDLEYVLFECESAYAHLLIGSGALTEGVRFPTCLQQGTGQIHASLQLTGQQCSRMQQR